MDFKPLWSPNGVRDPMRAQTASPGESRQQPNRPRKRKVIGGARGGVTQNKVSVWQRWEVSVPSNRLHREEVLERDRQRQLMACGGEHHRNFASPARSHAASLFFANVPGGDEVSAFLPPGAFRRVARPRTRQMQQMPNMATGSSTSSSDPAKGPARPASRAAPGAAAGGRNEQNPLPPELANEDLVFEGKEGDHLTEALENYASLTSGAEASAVWMNCTNVNQTSLIAVVQSLDSTSRNLMKTVTSQEGAKREALNDPYILRPIFCRFLLASKLCGDETSQHRYHDSVIAFDKHAVNLGAVVGMPRSHLLLLIAKMLREKGDAQDAAKGGKKDEIKYEYDPVTGDMIEKRERPDYIKDFFSVTLPHALDHVEGRKRKLDMKVAQMSAIEENAVPESVLEEITSGNVWPPLPPAAVSERQLKDWMAGVRRWQEELEEQVPARMLALRAHTETVLRGEVLSSQLLEPEVLHFTERFRPLFRHLFSAYQDWSTPQALLEAAEKTDADGEGSPEVDDDPHLGHLSFNAFFRFCVDFGIFPKHANFQEIQQVYNDAEASITIPLPTPPSTPSEESAFEPPPPPPMREERSSASKQRAPPPGARGSATSEGSSSPSKSIGVRMDTRPPRGSVAERDRVPQALMKSKKALQAAMIAESAAKAAAEAKVPKADLGFMEKPLSSLSSIALKTLTFFAAIDEWLSERFVRFADLLGQEAEIGEGAPVEVGEDVHKALNVFVKEYSQSASKEEGNSHEKDSAGAGGSSVGGNSPAGQRGSSVSQPGASPIAAGNAPGEATGAATTAPPLDAKPPPKDASDEIPDLPKLPPGSPALPDEVIQLQRGLLATPLPTNAGGNGRRNSAAERHARAAAAAAVAAAAAAALAVPPVPTISAKRLLEVISTMGMANQPSESEIEEMYSYLLFKKGTDEEPLGMTPFQLDKVLRRARETMDQARSDCNVLLRVEGERNSAEQACKRLLEALDQQMLERTTLLGAPEDIFMECGESGEVTNSMIVQLATGGPGEFDDGETDVPGLPTSQAMNEMFSSLSRDGTLNRAIVYRAVSFMQEGRRCQRRLEMRTKLHCLAHLPQTGPTTMLFGLAAFVECLLKLALHRLGGKGTNEIQRAAPAWWKCAWLIALLSGQYQEHLRRYNHEEWVRVFEAQESKRVSSRKVESDEVVNVTHVEPPSPTRTPKKAGFPYAKRGGPRQRQTVATGLAAGDEDDEAGDSPFQRQERTSPTNFVQPSRKSTPDGRELKGNGKPAESAEERLASLRKHIVSPEELKYREVDAWCERKRRDELPRYTPPLEVLIRERPGLFDLDFSEANVSSEPQTGVDSFWPATCPQCKEQRSPSGWGTPGCIACGGVEEHCLPIKRHLFAALTRTEELPPGMVLPQDLEGLEPVPEADGGMAVENW